MESGSYEVRSLDHEGTALVVLAGRPAGRLRRAAIVAFIAEHWAEQGYAPTLREILAAVGLRSISSAHRHLQLLEEAGRVAAAPGIPRSIRVVAE